MNKIRNFLFSWFIFRKFDFFCITFFLYSVSENSLWFFYCNHELKVMVFSNDFEFSYAFVWFFFKTNVDFDSKLNYHIPVLNRDPESKNCIFLLSMGLCWQCKIGEWSIPKSILIKLLSYLFSWKVFGLYGIQWFFGTSPNLSKIFLIRNILYQCIVKKFYEKCGAVIFFFLRYTYGWSVAFRFWTEGLG